MTRIEKIPIREIEQAVCAWKGCNRTVFIGDTLPAGWKCVVIAPGLLFKMQNLLSADVDGILCPEHFIELKGLLKVSEF